MNIIYTAQWLTGFVRKQIFSSFLHPISTAKYQVCLLLCLPRINNSMRKKLRPNSNHTQHILWLWTNVSDFFWMNDEYAHLYRNSTLWLSWLYLKHKSHPLTVPLSKWKKKQDEIEETKENTWRRTVQWRDLRNLLF